MLFNKILVYFTEVVPEIVWAATVVVNLIYLAGKKVLSFFFCLFVTWDSIPETLMWKKIC